MHRPSLYTVCVFTVLILSKATQLLIVASQKRMVSMLSSNNQQKSEDVYILETVPLVSVSNSEVTD